MAHPHRLYTPPKGGVGKRFVTRLAAEFKGVRERKWNSERPLIFAACVLRRKPGTIQAKDIRRRVENRLNLWEAGKFNALVQDIEAAAMQSVGGGRRTVDPDQIARNYNASVLDGNIRAAVRSVTNRDGGGVLLPEDLCTKTGRPVFEVLESKHPDTRIPNLDDPNNIAFEEYEELPDPIPLECLPETLEKVALRLHGSSGPSSVDAAALKTYLLRYGRASAELREEMAAWAEWLGNDSPPWAAIRGIMTRRLVALDKQPGVRPVGIGEIWLRCICKGARKGRLPVVAYNSAAAWRRG